MALEKIAYVNGLTKIPARNMNQIQDEIIRNSNNIAAIKKALANISGKVDTILTYNDKSEFPNIGEKGKLYIDLDSGKIYTWKEDELAYSKSSYISLSGTIDEKMIEEVVSDKMETIVPEMVQESLDDCVIDGNII